MIIIIDQLDRPSKQLGQRFDFQEAEIEFHYLYIESCRGLVLTCVEETFAASQINAMHFMCGN